MSLRRGFWLANVGGMVITVIGYVAQIQACFWMLKAWACDDLAEDGGLLGADVSLVLCFLRSGEDQGGRYHVARVEELCSRDCQC